MAGHVIHVEVACGGGNGQGMPEVLRRRLEQRAGRNPPKGKLQGRLEAAERRRRENIALIKQRAIDSRIMLMEHFQAHASIKRNRSDPFFPEGDAEADVA